MEQGATFRAKLEALLSGFFEEFRAHRAFLRVAFEDRALGSATRRGPRRAIDQLRDRLASLVPEGISEGALCPDRAALYPDLLVALVRTLFGPSLAGGKAPPDDGPAIIVDLFLRGAGRR